MISGPNDIEELSLAPVDYYLSVVAHKIQMLNMRVGENQSTGLHVAEPDRSIGNINQDISPFF